MTTKNTNKDYINFNDAVMVISSEVHATVRDALKQDRLCNPGSVKQIKDGRYAVSWNGFERFWFNRDQIRKVECDFTLPVYHYMKP